MLRRLLIVPFVAICALLAGVTVASASTHAPCAFRGASIPSIQTVEENVTTLEASGGIGGCPVVTTIASEGVHFTVAIQHYSPELGAWETMASVHKDKGWNRYWRYARQAYGSVTAICVNGDWRTLVTGDNGTGPDGWPPESYSSQVRTFLPGDSGVCGSFGGGD